MMIEPKAPADVHAPQASTPPTEPSPTPTPTAPPLWLAGFDVLLLVLMLLLSFLLASFAATNADLWLYLAVGKRISEGQYQFGVDPFCWTTQDAYWVNHAWLSSWLFYVVHQSLGGGALVVGRAILFTTAIGLLACIAWSPTTRWYVILCMTMTALAVSGRLFMSPLVFSFLFLAVTLFVLDRAGLLGGAKTGSARSLWCLPPLFALWANLDGWFILGPLVVGVCWAGVGWLRWRGQASRVPGQTLGLVFGVGLAACLLNPHHVRVFQLPTELAYLLVRAGDAIGLPLPDAIFANGRTVRIVQQLDPAFVLDRAAVASDYWTRSELGMNIAGLAVAPLFLLGVLAFSLVSFIRSDGSTTAVMPRLNPVRVALWFLFLIPALLMSRLIPFFALVAGPLTAMTLGEFLHWQQAQSNDPGAHDRGLRLVRLITLPFLLILVAFCWPGWLHAPVGDTHALHRVAWETRLDASLRRAVEKLDHLQEKETSNVFNIGADLSYACAWHAPTVRCSFDSRYALFINQAATYTRARLALLDQEKPAGDWQDLFQKHQVRHLIHSRLDQRKGPTFLLDSSHWLPRYVNGSVLMQDKGRTQVQLQVGVFTWNQAGWPKDAQQAQWNRQAFGVVPEGERPPLHGTLLPDTLSEWDLFLHGTGPVPVGMREGQMYDQFFKLHAQFEDGRSQLKRPVMVAKMLASFSATPEGILTTVPRILPFLLEDVSPRDLGPPALPILMIRSARKAVAENPNEIATYGNLMNAQDALYELQDYWIRRARKGQTPVMRDRIREYQRIATAFSIAQLQPSNYRAQRMLAELYAQQSLFDLALDRLRAAQVAMESRKVDANEMRELQSTIQAVERSVRQRLNRLQEKLGNKSPLQQAEYAFRTGTFTEFLGEKQQQEQPLALGKKASEILAGIRRESLKADEMVYYWSLQFDLALGMGQLNELAFLLRNDSFRKSVPDAFLARYLTLVGGVLGDYAMQDEGLRLLENAHRTGRAEQVQALPRSFAVLFDPIATLSAAAVWPIKLSAAMAPADMIRAQNNELYSAMAERGFIALEMGDTHRARELLATTLQEAGGRSFFSERPIAERYLEMLQQQP